MCQSLTCLLPVTAPFFVQWNLLLLEQVIARAYVLALEEAARQLGATPQYFR